MALQQADFWLAESFLEAGSCLEFGSFLVFLRAAIRHHQYEASKARAWSNSTSCCLQPAPKMRLLVAARSIKPDYSDIASPNRRLIFFCLYWRFFLAPCSVSCLRLCLLALVRIRVWTRISNSGSPIESLLSQQNAFSLLLPTNQLR